MTSPRAPRPADDLPEGPSQRVIVVSPSVAGTRLDKFLADSLPHVSRRRLMGLVKAGLVRIDGRATRPGTPLQGGERIEIEAARLAPVSKEKDTEGDETTERGAITVVHRDDDLLVVSKPPGVPCHGGAGLGTRQTLLEKLRADVLAGFGLVNRIDQDTSGLVVLVRDPVQRAALAEAFSQEGVVLKEYDALVEGVPDPASGTIELPLADPGHGTRGRVDRQGKPARTDYTVVESFGIAARVRAEPRTGRTHQIRIHLAAIGTPLLVDPLYGRRAGWRLVDRKGGPAARLTRTPLHSASITLPHPVTGKTMTFHAPLLADHRRALEVLRVQGGARRADYRPAADEERPAEGEERETGEPKSPVK